MAQILHFTPKPLAKIGFQRARRKRKTVRFENQLDLFVQGQGHVLQMPRTKGFFDEALVLDERGDERARQTYLDAIEHEDSKTDAYCNLGILESQAGNRGKAFDCFTNALKEDPRHLEAHYNLGNLYFETGDYGLASTHFEIALEIDSHYSNAWFNMGLVHAINKDFAKASSAFGRYVELVPERDGKKALQLLEGLRQSLAQA